MGLTLVVAAGDSGVAWSDYCNATVPASLENCACVADNGVGYGYFPTFPASCPYVTAVGATQLFSFESGAEISASPRTGSGITTGGGFSSYYSKLDFQSSAISSYFTRVLNLETFLPANGYNKQGRGYPDVALNGYGYDVISKGFSDSVTSTSASATLFAAMCK